MTNIKEEIQKYRKIMESTIDGSSLLPQVPFALKIKKEIYDFYKLLLNLYTDNAHEKIKTDYDNSLLMFYEKGQYDETIKKLKELGVDFEEVPDYFEKDPELNPDDNNTMSLIHTALDYNDLDKDIGVTSGKAKNSNNIKELVPIPPTEPTVLQGETEIPDVKLTSYAEFSKKLENLANKVISMKK